MLLQPGGLRNQISCLPTQTHAYYSCSPTNEASQFYSSRQRSCLARILSWFLLVSLICCQKAYIKLSRFLQTSHHVEGSRRRRRSSLQLLLFSPIPRFWAFSLFRAFVPIAASRSTFLQLHPTLFFFVFPPISRFFSFFLFFGPQDTNVFLNVKENCAMWAAKGKKIREQASTSS